MVLITCNNLQALIFTTVDMDKHVDTFDKTLRENIGNRASNIAILCGKLFQ